MPGPDPAVAHTRVAARRALAQEVRETLVLVGCSGGADSLALAAATAFEAPRLGLRAGAVVVDHGLQEDSARVAHRAAQQCAALGLDPVVVRQVQVDPRSGEGPEAAARAARRAALADAARVSGAAYVLLGHTRDDQAETVLLRLARGSGTRAVSGIPPRAPLEAGTLLRPFLQTVSRAQTQAACIALGLAWWDDPHNEDPRFTRVRARYALRHLEDQLGPGLVDGLVRSATLARQDADFLDELAADAMAHLDDPPWAVDALAAFAPAVRTRVWRLLAGRCGAAVADVGAVHVAALDALVTDWHGQGAVDLPGGLRIRRGAGSIDVEPSSL